MTTLSRNAQAPRAGIVHLGLGAFSRAHIALYTEDAIINSGGDWGIVGVSLRSSKVRDDLAPQQWAYTALQLNADQPTTRQVEVINNVLVATENPAAVVQQMAHPDIKIVSLTITEKGYCIEPSTGALDSRHPDIVHDLTNPLPVTAPGFIVRALEARKNGGHKPLTVLSCDNLPENGRVIKHVLLEFARQLSPELAIWIEEHCRFPSTMVDRITPATTCADKESVTSLTGLYDDAPVVHEPFSQWVIEDSFVSDEHPDWTSAGAEIVSDVRPYELMKLRMLNGSHSTLSYLGYLAGYKTISDTVTDKDFRQFTQSLWQHEIIPSLKAPPGVSLPEYAKSLMTRYENPNIQHLTWQIAMDGSQKLPQRILGTLENRLGQDAESPGLLLAIAAWMRYVGGIDEAGQCIDVRDPLTHKFVALSKTSSGPEQWVSGLLSLSEIFPAHIADQLADPLTRTYRALCQQGAHAMVRQIRINHE